MVKSWLWLHHCCKCVQNHACALYEHRRRSCILYHRIEVLILTLGLDQADLFVCAWVSSSSFASLSVGDRYNGALYNLTVWCSVERARLRSVAWRSYGQSGAMPRLLNLSLLSWIIMMVGWVLLNYPGVRQFYDKSTIIEWSGRIIKINTY